MISMKTLALSGLCVLAASAGGATSAQGSYHDGHGLMHHARPAIIRQKAAYARAVAHGNYQAAERAHLRAKAIRHHVRVHQAMHLDQMHTGHIHIHHAY